MLKAVLIILIITGLNSPVMVMAEVPKTEAPQQVSPQQILPQQIQDDAARNRLHIRSLAASCAACHSTTETYQANAGDSGHIVALVGMKPADFIASLLVFKSGERAATVMHHHAKGLTLEEITNLAAYFSSQTPRKAMALPRQKLLESHDN